MWGDPSCCLWHASPEPWPATLQQQSPRESSQSAETHLPSPCSQWIGLSMSLRQMIIRCPPESPIKQKNACLPLDSHHPRLNRSLQNKIYCVIISGRDILSQQHIPIVLERRIMISGPKSTVRILIMQRLKICNTYFLQQSSPNSKPGYVWLHISTSNILIWFITFFLGIGYNAVLSFLRKTFSISGRKEEQGQWYKWWYKGDYWSDGNLGWKLIVVFQQHQVTTRLLSIPTTLRKKLFSSQQI